jgi:hypothetical protein
MLRPVGGQSLSPENPIAGKNRPQVKAGLGSKEALDKAELKIKGGLRRGRAKGQRRPQVKADKRLQASKQRGQSGQRFLKMDAFQMCLESGAFKRRIQAANDVRRSNMTTKKDSSISRFACRRQSPTAIVVSQSATSFGFFMFSFA